MEAPGWCDGVSVALDETAREVSERQALPGENLRERFEQQRPITARVEAYSDLTLITRQLGPVSLRTISERAAWASAQRPLAPGKAEALASPRLRPGRRPLRS